MMRTFWCSLKFTRRASIPIEGITGERLAEAISAAGHKNVVFTSTMQAGVSSCCVKRGQAMRF